MKKSLIFGFLILFLFILYGLIFNGNHITMIIFFLSSIFLITVYYLRNKNSNVKPSTDLFLIIPSLLLFIISSFIIEDFSRSLVYIVFIPISYSLAYFYFLRKNILIIVFSFLLFIFAGIYLFSNTFTFVSNVNSEKNLPFPDINLVNNKNEKVIFSKNKIIVLDFWSTSCGICFEKFPDLEETYQKYKNNKKIEIYAVNFPLRGDNFNKTVLLLDSIGYNFPKLNAKSGDEIEKKLHFNTFPHLIIIKNNKIRFDGTFEVEKKASFFTIESEIDKLLNEN